MRRIPSPFASTALAALAGLAPVSCSRGEPPAWDGGSLSVAPLPYLAPADAGVAPAASGATYGADAGQSADPGLLPQTRDRPKDNPALQARAHALWDAIVRDEPEAGLPFFFPLAAYKQVKAIPNAEGDWKRRLFANYARDIHRLHARLGPHAADARLLELTVERGRWVEPNEESNKLGYWRVYGSKLRYETDRGPGTIELSSLISWRGEWYVVHLEGFK